MKENNRSNIGLSYKRLGVGAKVRFLQLYAATIHKMMYEKLSIAFENEERAELKMVKLLESWTQILGKILKLVPILVSTMLVGQHKLIKINVLKTLS